LVWFFFFKILSKHFRCEISKIIKISEKHLIHIKDLGFATHVGSYMMRAIKLNIYKTHHYIPRLLNFTLFLRMLISSVKIKKEIPPSLTHLDPPRKKNSCGAIAHRTREVEFSDHVKRSPFLLINIFFS